MNKTFKIAFSLKNTYRVNGILYSIRSIPGLKKIFPATMYKEREFKIIGTILSICLEILSTFLAPFLYVLFMIMMPGNFYQEKLGENFFLHFLFFLTIMGGIINTHLFNPTKDKYYAIFLMKMNPKEYALTDYIYYRVKYVIGFIPVLILFGLEYSIPVWFCLCLPFCMVGIGMISVGFELRNYEKTSKGYNENKLSKFMWLVVALLMFITYGLPWLGIALDTRLAMVLFFLCIPLGGIGIKKMLAFQDYREIYKDLLPDMMLAMDKDAVKEVTQASVKKTISMDSSIGSKKDGFEYLNELFFKRHKKIVWNAEKRISLLCLGIVAGLVVFIHVKPELKLRAQNEIINTLPAFVMIMYAVNRGRSFTQALFINCDHSLLTYGIYRKPKNILKLFQLRLIEIIKVNSLSALIIAFGLSFVLYLCGGGNSQWDYVVIIMTIYFLSVFFSIHYLALYYLLQPYNKDANIKSFVYQFVCGFPYVVAWGMLNIEIPGFQFGIVVIGFCLLYSVLTSVLVYFFAPKTFKIKG